MKRKPSGSKYRNLTLYRGEVWYVRTIRGKRRRRSLETTSWSEAADRRDALEHALGIPAKRARNAAPAQRTIAELADDYLENALHKHKPATVAAKRSHVKEIKASLGGGQPRSSPSRISSRGGSRCASRGSAKPRAQSST